MKKRVFEFKVRVYVKSEEDISKDKAQNFAKSAIEYNLLRDGHWLMSGTNGTVTVKSVHPLDVK